MKNSSSIMIGFQSPALAEGLRCPILWDTYKCPHAVFFGATGSGKTYLTKLTVGRVANHLAMESTCICDFKGDDDFSFLEGKQGFFRYEECSAGLDYAIDLLKRRQQGQDTSRSFFLLVFDEWASYLNFLDKKAAEAAKKKLSYLLMLGRSFNIHVLISQQRVDASYFNAARDNFSLIAGMGRLSKEAVDMMFSEYKDVVKRNQPCGYGSLIHGNDFHEIIVPQVNDIKKLHAAIWEAVI